MRKIFVFLISMLVIASCTDPFEDNENNGVGSGETNNSGATNKIYYTTSDGRKLFFNTSAFGAILVSNIYENGLGVLTFDDDITSIGDYAFRNCSSLTSITIPNSVTSIGNSVFYGCTSLKELCIEDGETVLSLGINLNGSVFFHYCPLETIYLGRNLSYGAFNSPFPNKTTLTSVAIGNSVTSIGEDAFYGCSGLTSIVIPNSVTSIGGRAFSGCSGLTSVTIPNSVTSIEGNAFEDCSGLTSITVSDGNTVYDSRDNCNSIIEVATNTLIAGCKNTIIPNSVTSIGNSAFSGCSDLTSVTIPNSVTSIGDNAFENCSGLTSIIIPNSVTGIGEVAFFYCSSLTSITVADGNTVYDSRDNCNAIIETATNTLVLGCKNTVIPNSVTSIGEWAFSGCSGLTGELVIPNSVTSIRSGAFYNCSGLTSVKFNAENCTSMGGERSVFSGCTALSTVTIGENVKTIPANAFSGCSGLTSITVADGNTVYDSRDNCNAIIETATNTLVLGCKNTVIPNSVTSIGRCAFYNCSGLTSVTIPNSVTNIGEYAFSGCSGLKEVHITDLDAWKKIYFGGWGSNPLNNSNAKLYLNGVEVK